MIQVKEDSKAFNQSKNGIDAVHVEVKMLFDSISKS